MVEFNFKTKFEGDNQYLPSQSSTVTINSVKGNIHLDVAQLENIDTNIPLTIYATCTNKFGDPVQGLTVNYSITDPSSIVSNQQAITDGNGVASIQYTPTLDGTYSISIQSNGNNYYNASNSELLSFMTGKLATILTFVVNKNSSVIGEDITLSGTLTDINNVPIANANISFNGITETTTTNNAGNFNIIINSLGLGSHELSAVYTESNKYLGAESTLQTVTVNKRDSTIVFKNTILIRGQRLYIQLTDSLGNRIAGERVNFTILSLPNDSASVITDSDGVAHVGLDISPAYHSISVEYLGNDSINPSTETASIRINSYAVVEKYASKCLHDTLSGVPYKNWPLLVNGEYNCTNGAEIVCGSKSSPIATASGSYNTPRGVLFRDFGLNIPSDATIKHLIVKWTDKVTNSSGGSSSNISCAVHAEQVRIMNIGTGNTGALKDNLKATYEGTDHNIAFNNPNATVSGVNSTNLGVLLKWGKNTKSNPGLMKCSKVRIRCEYIPYQPRPV